ncbi:MAG: DinB family protein [Bacteroidota bacterium]
MFKSSLTTIEQFKDILQKLPKEHYIAPCSVLSNATIGQHTRHIIELYLCLINGYECGVVSYDKRHRDQRIENDVTFAVAQLEFIQKHLEKPNKDVQMCYELRGSENQLVSNYFREVMYNLEHTIHHHALIKIGIEHFTEMIVPESFGVAPSTIEYRNTCAQ